MKKPNSEILKKYFEFWENHGFEITEDMIDELREEANCEKEYVQKFYKDVIKQNG